MVQTPHLVTVTDLFCNFDSKKVHGKGNIKRRYKCADKRALIKKIFLRYLAILFTEFLQGGSTFVFPGPKHFELRFRLKRDDWFKKDLAAGKLAGVDPMMTGFKYYEPVMFYKVGERVYMREVKLSEKYRNMVMNKANTGYKYC